MSISAASIRLALINGDMEAFLTHVVAPDEFEAIDGGPLGHATVALAGVTVITHVDGGTVTLHGHNDVDEARQCYLGAVDKIRAEVRTLATMAEPTPEGLALATGLALEVQAGRMNLQEARTQYQQQMRAAVTDNMVTVSTDDRTGMYL